MDFDKILGLIVAFFVILPLVGCLAYILISSYLSSVKEQKERINILKDFTIALQNIDSSLSASSFTLLGIQEKLESIDSIQDRLEEIYDFLIGRMTE